MDKRISAELFINVEVDPTLVEEILGLHSQEETSRGLSFHFHTTYGSTHSLLVRHYVDHTKEKATTRLAMTYGILRRLGFAEDWVLQCLGTISGIELDEALDWVSPAWRRSCLILTFY